VEGGRVMLLKFERAPDTVDCEAGGWTKDGRKRRRAKSDE